METGPYQGPSRLQRAYKQSCSARATSAAPLQTELAIDTNILVTDTHAIVTDAHMMVSDTRIAVSDTQTVVTKIEKKVADIHRDVLAGREGASGQNNSVGATWHSQTTNCLSLLRLKLGQLYRAQRVHDLMISFQASR